MSLVGLGAADEGVAGFDAVDEALRDEELEGAVDGRRLRADAGLAQGIEDLIGADRLVAAPDELEHAASNLGQVGAAAAADDSARFSASSMQPRWSCRWLCARPRVLRLAAPIVRRIILFSLMLSCYHITY